MRKILLLTAVLMLHFSCSNKTSDDENKSEVSYYNEYSSDAKGNLFLIGGPDVWDLPEYVMQTFIDLAGEGDKNVLIIPFASRTPEKTGMAEREVFLEMGVSSCDVLLSKKEDLDKQENLDKLEKANLVFFAGGGQSRLFEYLKGTELLNKIKSFYNDGGTIGGTSAGASVMSKIMMTGNERATDIGKQKLILIEKNNVVTEEGFGLMENVIIDQHFLYRKRHIRLYSALLDNPRVRGIGIDEHTAILVKPDETFQVVGDSKVLVYEPNNELSNDETPPTFTIKILSSGDIYKL